MTSQPNHRLALLSLTAVLLVLSLPAQAAERICPDGKRSYFGVCPDDGETRPSTPAPQRPAPQSPSPRSAFGIEMVRLPGGTFQMGCRPNDGQCDGNEKPRHAVTLRAFAIGKTEVTQGQWQAVMGSNPSHFTACGDDCPVEQVSWDDVQAFIAKLNTQTGGGYRLPSEAEWEYACRAGQNTLYCGADDEDAVAWYGANSDHTTHPVRGKASNGFGLYDMSGNVWEWVQDCWHDNYQGAPGDGRAWEDGANCARSRGFRGGDSALVTAGLRSDYRNADRPTYRSSDLGFRLAQD